MIFNQNLITFWSEYSLQEENETKWIRNRRSNNFIFRNFSLSLVWAFEWNEFIVFIPRKLFYLKMCVNPVIEMTTHGWNHLERFLDQWLESINQEVNSRSQWRQIERVRKTEGDTHMHTERETREGRNRRKSLTKIYSADFYVINLIVIILSDSDQRVFH